MFQAIFRRAQDAVENSIENSVGQVLTRMIVAVPFLLAAVFATAALSSYLTRELGAEVANLTLSAIFAVIGLIGATYVSARTPPARAGADEPPVEAAAQADGARSGSTPTSGVDHELLMAALTAAGPVALPRLLRIALRNIPVLIAVAVALFLASRQAVTTEPAGQPVPAGE